MASMKTTKALKNFRIKNFTRLCLCLYGLKMTSMKMTKALKNFRMASMKTTKALKNFRIKNFTRQCLDRRCLSNGHTLTTRFNSGKVFFVMSGESVNSGAVK